MHELAVIVPTRGRSQNAKRVVDAWKETHAFTDGAHLMFGVDLDDPHLSEYMNLVQDDVKFTVIPHWKPMVHKLNVIANSLTSRYYALGFAGDDHLPRTNYWAERCINALDGVGIVYANDLHRGEDLPTQWIMTSSIISAIGRMVPADVQHQFCDRSILDLGREAECITYLPNVVIEHVHYAIGKAEKDETYVIGNNSQLFKEDSERYRVWCDDEKSNHVAIVKALRTSVV